jgi:DNA polymerase III alpha subunit
VVNHLILSGAFDDFSADRRELLYYNNVALQLTDRETAQLKLNPHNSFVEGLKSLKVNKSRQKTIDGLIHSIEQPQSSLKDNDIWKNKTEEDLLGIPLSCSKLDESAKLDADTTCKEYNDGKGGNSSLAVEIITSKEIITKKSEKMAFLEIEDDTDCMTDIAVFPDKWEEYKNILYVGNTIVLTGYKSKTNSFIVQKATQI